MAIKCDTTFNVYSNTEHRYITVPCAVISDKYTLTNNSMISMVSGSVTVYTGDNSYARDMSIGETYYNYVIALPFLSYPKYKRMNNGSAGSWYNFYTTENVIIQSSTPGTGSFYG